MSIWTAGYWIPSLAAAFAVSLVSLSGAFTLWISPARLRTLVPLLVSLAIGVLLGDAFLHLIPESAEQLGSISETCLFVLSGILLFFTIEKIIRGQHHHEIFDAETGARPQPHARMNLIGDAVHNFTDGVLIAGSFAADATLGIATTAAILAHEIPQEIGDVGALIHGGYTPRRALVLNFFCALTVVAGVLATLVAGYWAAGLLPYLLPIAAGGFIYIAAADFIPALHARAPHAPGGALHDSYQVAVVLLGIGCMLGLGEFEHFLTGHG
ncbi:MAG: ZIP family metal transporter [Steroidobacteraceae bacterium]